MFGMSMTEVIIILVVALVLIGPKELPSIARTLGKTLRDVRKASDDLRDTFEREVMQEPVRPKKAPEATMAAGAESPQLPAESAATSSDGTELSGGEKVAVAVASAQDAAASPASAEEPAADDAAEPAASRPVEKDRA